MPKKKDSKVSKTKETKKKKDDEEEGSETEANGEEPAIGDESIDPSIIEDSFEEFSEYNDVDNF